MTFMQGLLAWGLCLFLGFSAAHGHDGPAEPLRFGLTPVFLQDRHALISRLRLYLEGRLKRPVSFQVRDSAHATLDLMQRQQLDVAWLCDCPYVTTHPEFRLLATPVFQGRPYYQAYLIVPAQDRTTRGMADLKGKVFAYTDTYSNVGYLAPRYLVRQLGEDPDRFHRRTFFTRSPRKSIEAVAAGVADAATVNSYIWETLHAQSPALTGMTRVADRPAEFGFPPLVAHQTLPEAEFQALRQALLSMHRDPEGRELLRQMNLDGFTEPSPDFYRNAEEMVRRMQGGPDARL